MIPKPELTNAKPKLTLSVIVPVYNEQCLVEASIGRLLLLNESPLLSRIKIIIVDDCSTDQTPASLKRFQESVAGNLGAGDKVEWIVLRHERNQGKGAAIKTGLNYADTDLTVIHDADLEYHPRDLLKMIPLFLGEGADAVLGSRFLVSEFKRVLFFRHALGNRLLTFLCDLACDLNISDMETCYKMVRTELLKSIPLESSDFRIEPEVVIKLAKRGAQIFEVPISYSGRTYLDGKKISWKDGMLALGAILRYAISDHIYTRDAYGSEILARLNRAPRFTRWMADTIRPYIGDRVLEIGAGIGNLTVHLMPRSIYWATDVNPLYLDALRRLSETRPYLRVAFTDVTALDSFPTDQQFDTVVCLNVLEHIKDAKAALQNIRRVLIKGGRAIILVPQGPRLYGSLDRALGHFLRYTKAQLVATAEQGGFCVTEVVDFNRAGAPAWWLNGCVLQRTRFSLWQIKVLNLLVPVFRRCEQWIPLPPLSLIAVLEKA
jgi:glycosyltransferase involved in cell wall biosynthesis/phospholipid N-methyltransferase